jgi:hypothetical protein
MVEEKTRQANKSVIQRMKDEGWGKDRANVSSAKLIRSRYPEEGLFVMNETKNEETVAV